MASLSEGATPSELGFLSVDWPASLATCCYHSDAAGFWLGSVEGRVGGGIAERRGAIWTVAGLAGFAAVLGVLISVHAGFQKDYMPIP